MSNEYFIDNNGVRIHTFEFNPSAKGVALVMVPGMGNAAEEIVNAIGNLLSRRTIIVSLRGRGGSDSPEAGWRVEDQASDIAAAIRYFGLGKIVVFGHSTGGSIAARALPMIRADVSGFIIGDFPPVYPKYSASWAERVKKMGLPMTTIALDGIVRDATQTNVSEYLHSVSSRLFAITGDPEKSLLKPEAIARLQELFPSIVIERLDGCGHEFLSDDPVRAMGLLENISQQFD